MVRRYLYKRVNAHRADKHGRSAYNNAMAEKRARAVAAYLRQRGIAQAKLAVTWCGEKHKLATSDDENDQRRSRRVDIKL